MVTNFKDMQYIILQEKAPTHSFKDGKGAKSWEEVKDFDNVAVIVPKGYIVLDFDTTSDADIMLKIVKALNLKTLVFKTTRGVHCWFKSPEEDPKNFIKNRLAIGIYSDRKVGGRNAYVKIKQDGKLRERIHKVPLSEVDILPKWLTSVSAPSGKFDFKEMGEGSGRNQELYNYILYLQSKGFKREEIREALGIINDYVFEDPLPESELATITRDEAFKDEEELLRYEVGDKFKHNDFGRFLIDKYHIVSVEGKLYCYVDDKYRFNPNLIEELCIKELDSITIRNRRETEEYIRIQAPKRSFSDPKYILFKNGVLDISTGEIYSSTTDYVIPNYIPHNYRKGAYNEALDNVLNNVSCHDPEIRAIIEEALGYCFYRENVEQKAIIFTGSGKNGKSTILNLFEAILTENNYSSESLRQLSDRFSSVSLYGKLANISDDIDAVTTVDSSMFKRICVKGSISAEFKGKDKFKFISYATPIFTANTVPKIGRGDDADAVNRRLVIVPFNGDFTPGSKNYDKHIEKKIFTDEALEYMIALAVEGLRRVLDNGFTNSTSAEEEKNDYIITSDPYSSFFDYLDEKYIDPVSEYITENYTGSIYTDFEGYCKENGYTDYNQTIFGKRVKDYYHLDKKLVQDRKTGRRKYKTKNSVTNTEM